MRKFTPEQREYNRLKAHEYYIANREVCCKRQREYRLKNLEQSRKHDKDNKEKKTQQRRAWREKNKARDQAYHRYKVLGISELEQKALWDTQMGLCAICKDPLIDIDHRTHLDHNHQTNKIRGFLCNHCNRGLGGFRDDPNILQEAIEYLRRSEIS